MKKTERINLHWNKKTFEVSSNSGRATADEISKEASKLTGIAVNRIRIYYTAKTGNVILRPKQEVGEAGTKDFYIKDSGPQISFRFAQLIEYVPSMFIWIIFLFIMKPEMNAYRVVLSIMWVFHYARRSFEVVFVHIFSNATMPIFSIIDNSSFKNCLYYWTFSCLQSYFTLREHEYCQNIAYVGVVIFALGEAGNAYAHIKLRLLRPKGSHQHFKPHGFLFDSIVSPNYTCEILSWIGFAMASQTIVSIIFPIAGGVQMFIWADEKRRKLGEQFPDVLNRGRLLPFKYF
jgi:hypothetical protein